MTTQAIYLVTAYIDPGTGGVVLQLLIAALVGVGFYFRRAVKKVVSWILRKPADDKREDHESR